MRVSRHARRLRTDDWHAACCSCQIMGERKRITCPETARPAEIDLERTALGVVIAGCSRFVPRCAVACTRDCAKRIDNRERADADDGERILIVYAGRTTGVARALSAELVRDGFTVELADAALGALPPPEDYDAIVIGANRRDVAAYLSNHRDALAAMPSFCFSVRESSLLHRRDEVARLVAATGWRPTEWVIFEGGGGPEIHDFALRIADLVPAAST